MILFLLFFRFSIQANESRMHRACAHLFGESHAFVFGIESGDRAGLVVGAAFEGGLAENFPNFVKNALGSARAYVVDVRRKASRNNPPFGKNEARYNLPAALGDLGPLFRPRLSEVGIPADLMDYVSPVFAQAALIKLAAEYTRPIGREFDSLTNAYLKAILTLDPRPTREEIFEFVNSTRLMDATQRMIAAAGATQLPGFTDDEDLARLKVRAESTDAVRDLLIALNRVVSSGLRRGAEMATDFDAIGTFRDCLLQMQPRLRLDELLRARARAERAERLIQANPGLVLLMKSDELAGDHGMIEMLRRRGATVHRITSDDAWVGFRPKFLK